MGDHGGRDVKDVSKIWVTISDEQGNIIKQLPATKLISMAKVAGFGKHVETVLKMLGVK